MAGFCGLPLGTRAVRPFLCPEKSVGERYRERQYPVVLCNDVYEFPAIFRTDGEKRISPGKSDPDRK